MTKRCFHQECGEESRWDIILPTDLQQGYAVMVHLGEFCQEHTNELVPFIRRQFQLEPVRGNDD